MEVGGSAGGQGSSRLCEFAVHGIPQGHRVAVCIVLVRKGDGCSLDATSVFLSHVPRPSVRQASGIMSIRARGCSTLSVSLAVMLETRSSAVKSYPDYRTTLPLTNPPYCRALR